MGRRGSFSPDRARRTALATSPTASSWPTTRASMRSSILSSLLTSPSTSRDTGIPVHRETIRATAKVEGKYKKQTGGRGQYGHVWLELAPLPEEQFTFVDKIFGGVVPQQYRPAVEKGVRETMAGGVLAGYPVTNVQVTLYDGSYHSVDSSEMAFKIAASMAFKKGMLQASPVLLEPIYRVEVAVPEEYMGDCIADLNRRRGKILGMESRGSQQLVRAQVPLAEMFHYVADLRALSQGRGGYRMEFHGYEEVPPQVAQGILEEAKVGTEATH